VSDRQTCEGNTKSEPVIEPNATQLEIGVWHRASTSPLRCARSRPRRPRSGQTVSNLKLVSDTAPQAPAPDCGRGARRRV